MAMVAKAGILPHIHMGGEGGGGCEEGGVGGGDVAVMERLSATTAVAMVVAMAAVRVAVKAQVEEGGEGRGRVCAIG